MLTSHPHTYPHSTLSRIAHHTHTRRYRQELHDDFDKTGTNTIVRAYEYTGFAPLVKDSEGWAKAIARFNPDTKDDTTSSDDSDDALADPYAEAEKSDLRKESLELAKEVLDRHFARQEAILKATIEEDRALAARIRATAPVNSFAGFDAGHDANIARLEAHEASKKKKRADEVVKRQRLRHVRARRDVEDSAVYDSVVSKLNGRAPVIGDISSSQLICLCRYLGLKPTPNAGGKVNKTERFAAFRTHYVTSV